MNKKSTIHWATRLLGCLVLCIAFIACSERPSECTLTPGHTWKADGSFQNFILTGQAYTEKDAEAALLFHTDGNSGYEVLFRNGTIDGTPKTGSLSAVRNLYRSLAADGEWFDFEVAVRNKNIAVRINGTDVVCYTEPSHPYRIDAYAKRLLSQGDIIIKGKQGKVQFRNLTITPLDADAINPNDTLPPVDEQTDAIIRLQQQNFPVIDYHVHLKGGLTKEMAHALSMNYGINYGPPGEGLPEGISTMSIREKMVPRWRHSIMNPLWKECTTCGCWKRWKRSLPERKCLP